MRLYFILIVIIILLLVGAYFYFDWGTTEEPEKKTSLKDSIAKMSFKAFNRKYPDIDRKIFIEIKNAIKHDPESVTEDYLKELLE